MYTLPFSFLGEEKKLPAIGKRIKFLPYPNFCANVRLLLDAATITTFALILFSLLFKI